MEQSLPTKACSFWQERGSNIFPGVFLSGPFYFQRPMPVSQMGRGFAGSQWLCCSPFGSITGSCSPDAASDYASENNAFSFCLVSILLRKTAQCSLENLWVRGIERRTTVNSHPERFQTKYEKLYESEKRTELIQTTPRQSSPSPINSKISERLERSRHCSPINFLVNFIAGLIAYCHQPKKQSLGLPSIAL